MATHLMLYSLTAALIIMALVTPIIAIAMFKRGYAMGVRDYNVKHRDEPKTLPKKKNRKAQKAADDNAERLYSLLENIENYDGTSAKQKEIN